MDVIILTMSTMRLLAIRVLGADSCMLPRFILYFYPDDAPNSDRSIIKTFYNYMDCFMYRRKILRERKLDKPGSLVIKVQIRNENGKLEEW